GCGDDSISIAQKALDHGVPAVGFREGAMNQNYDRTRVRGRIWRRSGGGSDERCEADYCLQHETCSRMVIISGVSRLARAVAREGLAVDVSRCVVGIDGRYRPDPFLEL